MRILIMRLRNISLTAVVFPLFFLLFCLFASVPNARAVLIEFELDYAGNWHPAPNEIIGTQTDTVQIHFIGDIVTLFFSRSDDILVENLTTNTQYAGDDFFDGCEYYPMTPLLEGETSADCDVHEVIGDTGSPRIDLFVDSSIWSEFSDGDVIQITLLDQTSTPTPETRLIARLNADLFFLVQSVDVSYTFQTADGVSPYFIDNFDLDGTEADIAPYGYSSPVQFFAPHGKISGTLSEIPGYANMVVEPEWPEDLQLIGTPEEGTGHIIFDIFSDIGFEIDTPYYFGFMSDGSPYLQFHPELPPTQDLSGEFLVCGPDCSETTMVADTSGVEFQFRTAKVRIDNFPFQGYTLKMDPTSLPLSMEVAGRRKGEVNEVYLNVSEGSLGSLSTYFDTSSSFARDNTEFLPEDLAPLSTTDIQLAAQAYEGTSVDAGFDYVTYTYEPVSAINALHIYKLPAPNDDLVCVDYDGPETVETFRFYVQEEREPDLGSVVYDNLGCTLTAMFTPQGTVEKLFAVAIVSEEDKIAYISNRITITEDSPLNLPGKNFWVDLSGDHELTSLDTTLANNYFNQQILDFPQVMPHDGDSGAVAGYAELSEEWEPTDIDVLGDVILSIISLKDVPGAPETNEFQVLSLPDGESVDGRIIFANIGGAAGEVYTRVWDHEDSWTGSVPVAGLGINYTWSGPVQLVNAFSKELPSGTTFNPSTDDINGNGFQDCCYASDDSADMDCNAPVTPPDNCALGVTWEIVNNIGTLVGYAVGPNQDIPVLQNLSEVPWEVDVSFKAWIPPDPDLVDDVTVATEINFSIKVPKPQITMVGTKSVTPETTETFNGTEQHIIADFPYYYNLSSVADNQIVKLDISSSVTDCLCYAETFAPMEGVSFGADVDFSSLCGIPSTVMDCDFQITATGYDSKGFPSLESDAIQIHVDPRETSVPPIIKFPENGEIYSAQTWNPEIIGEGAALTTVNIYDGCEPSCLADPPGSNCNSNYIAYALTIPDGNWMTTYNAIDGVHEYYAMEYYEDGDCAVSDPVSFEIDENLPPATEPDTATCSVSADGKTGALENSVYLFKVTLTTSQDVNITLKKKDANSQFSDLIIGSYDGKLWELDFTPNVPDSSVGNIFYKDVIGLGHLSNKDSTSTFMECSTGQLTLDFELAGFNVKETFSGGDSASSLDTRIVLERTNSSYAYGRIKFPMFKIAKPSVEGEAVYLPERDGLQFGPDAWVFSGHENSYPSYWLMYPGAGTFSDYVGYQYNAGTFAMYTLPDFDPLYEVLTGVPSSTKFYSEEFGKTLPMPGGFGIDGAAGHAHSLHYYPLYLSPVGTTTNGFPTDELTFATVRIYIADSSSAVAPLVQTINAYREDRGISQIPDLDVRLGDKAYKFSSFVQSVMEFTGYDYWGLTPGWVWGANSFDWYKRWINGEDVDPDPGIQAQKGVVYDMLGFQGSFIGNSPDNWVSASLVAPEMAIDGGGFCDDKYKSNYQANFSDSGIQAYVGSDNEFLDLIDNIHGNGDIVMLSVSSLVWQYSWRYDFSRDRLNIAHWNPDELSPFPGWTCEDATFIGDDHPWPASWPGPWEGGSYTATNYDPKDYAVGKIDNSQFDPYDMYYGYFVNPLAPIVQSASYNFALKAANRYNADMVYLDAINAYESMPLWDMEKDITQYSYPRPYPPFINYPFGFYWGVAELFKNAASTGLWLTGEQPSDVAISYQQIMKGGDLDSINAVGAGFPPLAFSGARPYPLAETVAHDKVGFSYMAYWGTEATNSVFAMSDAMIFGKTMLQSLKSTQDYSNLYRFENLVQKELGTRYIGKPLMVFEWMVKDSGKLGIAHSRYGDANDGIESIANFRQDGASAFTWGDTNHATKIASGGFLTISPSLASQNVHAIAGIFINQFNGHELSALTNPTDYYQILEVIEPRQIDLYKTNGPDTDIYVDIPSNWGGLDIFEVCAVPVNDPLSCQPYDSCGVESGHICIDYQGEVGDPPITVDHYVIINRGNTTNVSSLEIVSPDEGELLSNSTEVSYEIKAAVSGYYVVELYMDDIVEEIIWETIDCGDTEYHNGTLTLDITGIPNGFHKLFLKAYPYPHSENPENAYFSRLKTVEILRDTSGPILIVNEPWSPVPVGTETQVISGYCYDQGDNAQCNTVLVNNNQANLDSTTKFFTCEATLSQDTNQITVVAKDTLLNSTTKVVWIMKDDNLAGDNEAPTIFFPDPDNPDLEDETPATIYSLGDSIDVGGKYEEVGSGLQSITAYVEDTSNSANNFTIPAVYSDLWEGVFNAVIPLDFSSVRVKFTATDRALNTDITPWVSIVKDTGVISLSLIEPGDSYITLNIPAIFSVCAKQDDGPGPNLVRVCADETICAVPLYLSSQGNSPICDPDEILFTGTMSEALDPNWYNFTITAWDDLGRSFHIHAGPYAVVDTSIKVVSLNKIGDFLATDLSGSNQLLEISAAGGEPFDSYEQVSVTLEVTIDDFNSDTGNTIRYSCKKTMTRNENQPFKADIFPCDQIEHLADLSVGDVVYYYIKAEYSDGGTPPNVSIFTDPNNAETDPDNHNSIPVNIPFKRYSFGVLTGEPVIYTACYQDMQPKEGVNAGVVSVIDTGLDQDHETGQIGAYWTIPWSTLDVSMLPLVISEGNPNDTQTDFAYVAGPAGGTQNRLAIIDLAYRRLTSQVSQMSHTSKFFSELTNLGTLNLNVLVYTTGTAGAYNVDTLDYITEIPLPYPNNFTGIVSSTYGINSTSGEFHLYLSQYYWPGAQIRAINTNFDISTRQLSSDLGKFPLKPYFLTVDEYLAIPLYISGENSDILFLDTTDIEEGALYSASDFTPRDEPVIYMTTYPSEDDVLFASRSRYRVQLGEWEFYYDRSSLLVGYAGDNSDTNGIASGRNIEIEGEQATDFNGDGYNDVLMVNNNPTGIDEPRLFLNSQLGTLIDARNGRDTNSLFDYGLPYSDVYRAVAGKLMPDSNLDVAIISENGSSSAITIYQNDLATLNQFTDVTGDAFLPSVPTGYFGDVELSDLDGDYSAEPPDTDGLDILLFSRIKSQTQAHYVFSNNGNGTFTQMPGVLPSITDGIGDSFLLDLNQDGYQDLILMPVESYDTTPPACYVLLNNGTGNFGNPIDCPDSASIGTNAQLDVAVVHHVNASDEIFILVSNTVEPLLLKVSISGGVVTLTDETDMLPAGLVAQGFISAKFSDLNGDGETEIIVGLGYTENTVYSSIVVLEYDSTNLIYIDRTEDLIAADPYPVRHDYLSDVEAVDTNNDDYNEIIAAYREVQNGSEYLGDRLLVSDGFSGITVLSKESASPYRWAQIHEFPLPANVSGSYDLKFITAKNSLQQDRNYLYVSNPGQLWMDTVSPPQSWNTITKFAFDPSDTDPETRYAPIASETMIINTCERPMQMLVVEKPCCPGVSETCQNQ